MKLYYVYILTNYTKTVFYTGITDNIQRRTYEHNNELIDGFTKKYNVKILLYYEVFNDVTQAIAREKVLKRWKKNWKWNLIQKVNPKLINLYDNGNILPLENDNAYV